ncbi:uncharacterized protein EDB91DRAFT_1339272 [Suillus paluster]|uniref:uncharacterized protein n=1 Tax=Suillus paluster TaxID=48578 RepID=UPI001B873A77|nr:uncharacterized protein EDB91DRAFT_1339272 [Suillus paluster]KAG1728391.1 hypothetical protein EDB91DRAFT_1339272 [Suillus paluster]
MKFAWLTTLIVSAALMTGVAIASEDLTLNPQNLPCDNADQVGCSRGIQGYNNGNDFGYFCGSDGKITQAVQGRASSAGTLLNSNVPDLSVDMLAFARVSKECPSLAPSILEVPGWTPGSTNPGLSALKRKRFWPQASGLGQTLHSDPPFQIDW